jgi:DUF1680 family protein
MNRTTQPRATKLLATFLLLSCALPGRAADDAVRPSTAANSVAADYPVHPVPFTSVKFTDGLWHDRQETNNRVTLPFALGQLETSRRLENFDLAADTMKRRAAGDKNFQHKPPTVYPFDDTDAYKVIEGAAFCLSVQPDPAIQAQIESIIARIAAAQEADGYLYTWRTMHPDSPAHEWIDQKRWLKDPQLSHELYNLGHLYEAAVAYQEATKSKSLTDISLKSAELLQKDFGDGKLRIAPGHEVIEMGLAKLYRLTGDERWLKLAQIFLEARGHGGEYSQDHKPVLEQREAVGHAVRANYLYSGMADIAALKGDPRYLEAISAIWNNVVDTKLHLTGGVGARAAGEAYGDSYELPNRCYNETCAAIGFIYWNQRMFLMTGDGKFFDVLERTLYNGFLSGVSLSGDRFFYPNPLAYDGHEANNHGHAGRAPWFGCACCPPNLLRTLASLGGYVYATQHKNLYVNLYAHGEGTMDVEGVKMTIAQETRYPWDGAVKLTLTPQAATNFALRLRIPGWARGNPVPSDLYSYDDPKSEHWTIRVNGELAEAELDAGYAVLHRTWGAGDIVELNLPMPVRRVAGNEHIADLRGMVALERGPIVYTFEGVDNGEAVDNLVLPASAEVRPVDRSDFLGGVTTLEVDGAQRVTRQADGSISTSPAKLVAIPYAVWNNRGLSPMAVWLPRDAKSIRVPLPPTIAATAKVSVSFARDGMDLKPINDRQMPQNATDGFPRHFDFWPHKGDTESVTYEFDKPARVTGVTVSWFSDEGTGECRLPKTWRLLYRDDAGDWKPAPGSPDYAVRKSEPVQVTIDPVVTSALRLELDLVDNFSAGLYEWTVETADQ